MQRGECLTHQEVTLVSQIKQTPHATLNAYGKGTGCQAQDWTFAREPSCVIMITTALYHPCLQRRSEAERGYSVCYNPSLLQRLKLGNNLSLMWICGFCVSLCSVLTARNTKWIQNCSWLNWAAWKSTEHTPLGHPASTSVHRVGHEPPHPHGATTFTPHRLTLLSPPHSCPQAAPPKAHFHKQAPGIFQGKVKHLLSHLCSSRPFTKCKRSFIKFLFIFKCFTDKFSYVVSLASFSP